MNVSKQIKTHTSLTMLKIKQITKIYTDFNFLSRSSILSIIFFNNDEFKNITDSGALLKPAVTNSQPCAHFNV